MKKLSFTLLLLLLPFLGVAYDYYIAPHEIDAIEVEESNPWDLSKNEWQRYQRLMEGEAGHWYQNLDPIEVLGIYAETDSERERYAVEVMNRKEIRENQEWSFSNAVDKEAQRRYRGLPLVNSFDVSPFSRSSKP